MPGLCSLGTNAIVHQVDFPDRSAVLQSFRKSLAAGKKQAEMYAKLHSLPAKDKEESGRPHQNFVPNMDSENTLW
jgi:hypothetical protein